MGFGDIFKKPLKTVEQTFLDLKSSENRERFALAMLTGGISTTQEAMGELGGGLVSRSSLAEKVGLAQEPIEIQQAKSEGMQRAADPRRRRGGGNFTLTSRFDSNPSLLG